MENLLLSMTISRVEYVRVCGFGSKEGGVNEFCVNVFSLFNVFEFWDRLLEILIGYLVYLF